MARVRYSRLGRSLREQSLDDEYEPNDERHQEANLRTMLLRRGVPVKSILLALFLFGLGSLLLTLGLLVHLGHIKVKDESKGLALIILGCLTFIPGFYECRIAYYTWRGFPGYDFSSIPEL